MKRSQGFTIIELLIVLLLVGVGLALFVTQKANIDASARDNQRKTAINAMYYNLEEVFYTQNNHYPESIDSKTLRAMDPDLFTDPSGQKLGETFSSYHYEGTNCNSDGQCKHYKLSADLEREAEYIKTSRR